ncbi:succinate dehydrogenase/fumarate reductase iron-sulfur subunit [Sulfurovum sp. TSL1]|uniref:succinate dehydrogenase/fumarate reductase iron-sulfur subunit n=1 Tax=Sulfurovum sp. TSL1 TaxID=2826994 RepID=UPI001CC46FC0|nr:succinate dehydrogenase/fumarate reductase iron-sulfur subunit [Sulfurovum sp. TSL1]GIT97597.1 succinate dehydrogenase iron-sulfur subunit [Sulfurovum sp. TSL1]
MSETRKVTIKAFRFNAETDYLPYTKQYEMEVGKDDLILDLMNRIKWEHDGSFSYRRSCRHGICGACAIKVNGKAVLACKQNAIELLDLFDNDITLEPSSKKRAIKDMIIDKSDFWEKHAAIKPYVVADVDPHPTHETKQSISEFNNFLDSDLCIQCGACHYSCPALEVNPEFFGPAAFAAAYRFTVDTRDSAGAERLELTAQAGQGVWDCVKCFECAEACPKEINPIEKITKLHNMQFEQGIAERNVATKHAEGFLRGMKKYGYLDEADIVTYSEGLLGAYKHIGTAMKMMKSGKIHWHSGVPFIDSIPKIKNLDEVQKLIEISQTNKL